MGQGYGAGVTGNAVPRRSCRATQLEGSSACAIKGPPIRRQTIRLRTIRATETREERFLMRGNFDTDAHACVCMRVLHDEWPDGAKVNACSARGCNSAGNLRHSPSGLPSFAFGAPAHVDAPASAATAPSPVSVLRTHGGGRAGPRRTGRLEKSVASVAYSAAGGWRLFLLGSAA